MKRPEPCQSQTPGQNPAVPPGGSDGCDGERAIVGSVGDDAESLVRLQKTVTALAYVHAILVRLRARLEEGGGGESGTT